VFDDFLHSAPGNEAPLHYIVFSDDPAALIGNVPRQYEHIAQQCDILMRGLAAVGIIAP
jgi:hypothetical protein